MKHFYYLLLVMMLFTQLSCNHKQATTPGVELLPPEAMHQVLISSKEPQLIDVRTKEEFAVSHLKDAQNICVTDADFEKKITQLDKTKPVYLYCKKGGRSSRAAKILKTLGFTKIYDLQGGITNWKKQNLTIEQ